MKLKEKNFLKFFFKINFILRINKSIKKSLQFLNNINNNKKEKDSTIYKKLFLIK